MRKRCSKISTGSAKSINVVIPSKQVHGISCAIFSNATLNKFFSLDSWKCKNEESYFHWITNRAIRDLEATGVILSERRTLNSGGTVKLIWRKGYRYYKRDAASLVKLVNEYSDPNIGAALGLQGEAMILEGFARLEFVMKGRDVNQFGGRHWTKSEHDLDLSSSVTERLMASK